MENYIQRFQAIDHPHVGRAEALGALLLELEGQLVATAEAQFIQGHGDFHPKNILIGQKLKPVWRFTGKKKERMNDNLERYTIA